MNKIIQIVKGCIHVDLDQLEFHPYVKIYLDSLEEDTILKNKHKHNTNKKEECKIISNNTCLKVHECKFPGVCKHANNKCKLDITDKLKERCNNIDNKIECEKSILIPGAKETPSLFTGKINRIRICEWNEDTDKQKQNLYMKALKFILL